MVENGTFNNSINSLNINGTTTRIITSRCTTSDRRIGEVGIFYFSIGSVNVDGAEESMKLEPSIIVFSPSM